MRKDEIVQVTAILRKSYFEKRKLKNLDLNELSAYLSLDEKSIEDVDIIRQEEVNYLRHKVQYFERVNNPRKLEEYKYLLKNCEILFKAYFSKRKETIAAISQIENSSKI